MNFLLKSLGLAGFVLTSSLASAVTISFEDQASSAYPGYVTGSGPVAPSNLATNQYASLGVHLSGVAFIVLGSGHATSGEIGLGGVDGNGFLTYSGNYFTATFDGVTDFVSIRGDNFGARTDVTLHAFDIHGNEIGSHTLPDSGGETLQVALPGIHSVTFSGNGSTALDDLVFNAPTPASTPDGGSALAMLGGALMLVSAFRRSTKSSV